MDDLSDPNVGKNAVVSDDPPDRIDVADTVERGVKDSAKRLDRDMGVPANGLGEGCSEEIRTVNEIRVVAVPGDAVIEGSPLIPIGGVLGHNDDTAGEGAGGEIGRRRRHPAEGRGAKALVLAVPGVPALQNENGEFLKEGRGKGGIDAERNGGTRPIGPGDPSWS